MMRNSSAVLAEAITRKSSKQSYLIARLLVDKDLVDDCLRAYAYFRRADDTIDVIAQTVEERLSFIERQKDLIDRLYKGERKDSLRPEEAMVADLIAHDRGDNSGLQTFMRSFAGVLIFDARRKGRLIRLSELTWYSRCLGRAVTDAIQYFIGNDFSYPNTNNRYLAATAAHITHMLRDMEEDLNEGFINIPMEWFASEGIDAHDIDASVMSHPAFQNWVRSQVKLAREYFQEGKKYLDELAVLRCKIAGYWYCARFECVLDVIERDDYVLRSTYSERSKLSHKLQLGWIAISLAIQHTLRRLQNRQAIEKRLSW